MKRNWIFFGLILITACQSLTEKTKKIEKPNIIILMADDMGFSDLGCTGGEISTPNLDKLAENGVLFTHFYSTPRCSPSRASLLTGLYPHQAGVGHLDEDWGKPGYRGFLNDHCVTIAEVLVENGYRTIMIGKWHIGNKRENWPDMRGFEKFYSIPKGGGLYFYPSKFLDREIFQGNEKVIPDSNTFYSTDNFTEEAIKYIRAINSEDKHKPFFLYLAYIAPHFPLQAWPKDIEKYRGKYFKGYKTIREKRFEKQVKLKLFPENMQLSPDDFPDWNQVNQNKEDMKMAVYAAQIDRMDQNIGKLVNELKKTGDFENTVIFFLSDNGACHSFINNTPEAPIGTKESFVSYGNWSVVSNTPYRLYKRYTHEGGIITPLIVHWPSGIQKKGVLQDEPSHIIDIMPTCLDLAEVDYPDVFNGKTIIPFEGRSLVPLIKEKKETNNRALFWEHEGNQAVRTGNWKLVRQYKKPWELYNLTEDPTEMNNVINQKPKKATEFLNKYKKWMKKCGVEVWPKSSITGN